MQKNGRLIIFRHGQTQYNVEKRMTGHTNIPLTQEGIAQGKRIGGVLKQLEIDILYASPLDRAQDTLKLALDASETHESLKNEHGEWDIRTRFELIEKDVGDFAGVNHKTDPRLKQRPQTYDSRLPNGESNKDVVERIQTFYDEELKPLIDEGKTVCISCHAVVLKAFMVVLGDITGHQMRGGVKALNATPWIVDYQDGQKISSQYVDPEKVINKTVFVPKPKFPNKR